MSGGALRILQRTPGSMAARVRSILRDRAAQWQQPEQFFDARVDRLYADAPLSFLAYRPEALARAFANTSREDAEALAALPPRTFLELAAPLPMSGYELSKIGALRSLLQGEQPRARDYRQLDPGGRMAEAYPEFAGADQVPYLDVRRGASDEAPLRVWGHEGRHRNFAASLAWGDEPLAVRLRAYDPSTYDRLLREREMLNERAAESDLDELYPQHVVPIPPERYAAGGEVDRPPPPPVVWPPPPPPLPWRERLRRFLRPQPPPPVPPTTGIRG